MTLVDVRRQALRLGGQAITLAALGRRLAERLRREPGLRVIVQTESGVALASVIDVLDRVAAAGVVDMTLRREPEP